MFHHKLVYSSLVFNILKGAVPVSLTSGTSTEVGFILEDVFSLFRTVLEKLVTSVIRRREFLHYYALTKNLGQKGNRSDVYKLKLQMNEITQGENLCWVQGLIILTCSSCQCSLLLHHPQLTTPPLPACYLVGITQCCSP